MDAQGEDVVAGIRTPQTIDQLKDVMPNAYNEFVDRAQKLEDHYRDMQDIEFTVENNKLWMLQTRGGKPTAAEMVRIAMELLKDGLVDEKSALLIQEPAKLDELLHPVFDEEAIKAADVLAKGLPASPGAATGQVVLFADEADKYPVSILVRVETSPEDLEGMNIAKGILTARGGMRSHAAVVARGMGKCCISSAAGVVVSATSMTVGGVVYKEGDFISLNGTTGIVYDGKVDTMTATLDGDFAKLMELAEKNTRMYVRTNADTPDDAKAAREFGAKGIGLCRTEHMFFEGDRIKAVREMILADNEAGRRKALAKLLPYQRDDFYGIFKAMHDLPVTVRTLDPPLHEFLPHDDANQQVMANEMGITLEEVKAKVEALHEFNPMLGHRGCRLGVTYPEITEMQARAIIEAACDLKKEGINALPEIMIPLIGTKAELKNQKARRK